MLLYLVEVVLPLGVIQGHRLPQLLHQLIHLPVLVMDIMDVLNVDSGPLARLPAGP